ncbi:MAG TPA: Lrp/AsnC family transcriptional regulator [Sphingomonadaceae bacterium]|nr:Lrp/AsnC family transcriptional regulator [Sphingomonadaceae bacterium]
MKHTYQIDEVDKKILTLIQRDATISHAMLADQVGASSASCWRRVKAMEDAGILTAVVRLADPAKLGYGVNVLCNVRIANQPDKSAAAFEEFTRRQHEIIECYSTSGDWDYLLRIVATDVADYNAFLTTKVLQHPSVAAASSHFVLETIKFTTALPV